MAIKDRFSKNAGAYASFRPNYPAELFQWIYRNVRRFDLAWDCGTGSGQVARELSLNFKKVIATDISSAQIGNAFKSPNIEYRIESASKTQIPNQTVNLITVAQAIHWFNIEKFFSEVKRVSHPGAVIAIWGYGLIKINKPTDPVINHFYKKVIGPYWDPERSHIDNKYRTIDFPFKEKKTPAFSINMNWNSDQLFGYLKTWSSVQKYIDIHKTDPLEHLKKELEHLLGAEKFQVSFPLFLRLGTI